MKLSKFILSSKFTILAFITAIFTGMTASADVLPNCTVKNWVSFHAVNKSSHHAAAVNTDGSVHFFLMKRSARLNNSWPIELEIRVERKSKTGSSKWSKKNIKKDGFIQPKKVDEDADKFSIEGVVTGDVKFKMNYEFTKAGVKVTAEFVGKPEDADKADYRLIMQSKMGYLVTMDKDDADDEKAIKSKTRGSEITMETRKSKRLRLRMYDKIEEAEITKAEVTSIQLKAEKIGRKKLTWSLANPKLGSFTIDPVSTNEMPYRGFTVSTVLADENGNKVGEGVLLEYK